jgi:hypothetical protein
VSVQTTKRNGSSKAYAGRMPLQDHSQLGRRLRDSQAGLMALADALAAAYGKSTDMAKYARRLAEACNTLRGQLARQLDSEHLLTTAATRAACYAPPGEDAGA